MPSLLRIAHFLLASLLVSACHGAPPPAEPPLAESPAPAIETLIEERLDALATGNGPVLRGESLAEAATLRTFYTRRAFAPAWSDPRSIEALERAIRASEVEGLNPRDYHLDALLAMKAELAARRVSPWTRAEADLLFSDALARLAGHYAFGKVDPATHEPSWNIRAPDANRDAAEVLARLAGPSVDTAVLAELPQHPAYHALRQELLQLRLAATRGGWPEVPAGDTLKPGADDPRITALRQRLRASGDLSPDAGIDSTRYDDTLRAAVERFQSRHGLTADGAVGRGTLAELNMPITARIDMLRVNLDRARVLLRALPARFVLVNIAGFRIYYIDNGKALWQSRVVVGQRYRETPLFRSAINYLQWNPTWTVPPGIIEKDILPPKNSAAVIARKHLKVYDRNGNRVNPWQVNWQALRKSRGYIPYTLRQDPGPQNALGRVKFMFPNNYSVYLHDTPSTGLFDDDERTFSSGCVRVEDPLTLARLLINDPAWDDARIAAVIAGGNTENLVLKTPVPVLLAYWTAWIDENGSTQFRRDVYARDPLWLAALDKADSAGSTPKP